MTAAPTLAPLAPAAAAASAQQLTGGAIAGIVIAVIVLVVLLAAILVLVCKERAGVPVFGSKLSSSEALPIAKPGSATTQHEEVEVI